MVETLSHAGPITRTVGDAVQMLEVMLGPDARDRTSMPVPSRWRLTRLMLAWMGCA